jgi:predicted RNase H-like nuclease (RuvC/YqgF family)
VIAEGNETPGGESGGTPEGRGRLNEGDILAERRARRAAESGEHALTLRAEAAEATVRTLETHVASLQQQLRESEQEAQRLSERIDATRQAQPDERSQGGRHTYAPERDAALERELQRASQREYAEQRLRLEAEERCGEIERETRTEIERLGRRVDASERDAQELGARLEAAQRELVEAEQALAAQQVAVQQSERELRERLSGLERQAEQLHGGLETERAARERAEQMLAALQQAQRGAQLLLSGLADTVARLRETTQRQRVAVQPAVAEAPAAAIVATPTGATPTGATPPIAWRPLAPRAPEPPASTPTTFEPESAPARQRSESSPAAPTTAQARSIAPGEASGGEMAAALAAAVERLRARVEEQAIALQPPAAKAPQHKHTMSLIARSRLALRQRREQRKQRRAA